MNSRTIHSCRLALLTAVYVAVIGSMLLAAPLQAASPQGGEEAATPNATTADDGGAWELGVHGTAGNLPTATAAERYGMWYWLNGWFVRRYSFNESSAWEEDFKRAASGGTENSYIDSVDLQFYVGHGSPGLFTFDNASHDDGTLNAPADCNATWGDNDNEWLALTSCQVLSGSGLGAMAQCMNRQHLILGFVTNASAHNNYWDTQAYHFGRYLRYGYNMTQAWFNACDVADRGRTVRVIAEETACFSDNPYYSSVCADVLDSDYYWYTHNCGTASASYVPADLLQGQVPIFKVDPYSTADAAEDFQMLGDVFGIPVTSTLQTAWTSEGPDNPPDPVVGGPFLVSSSVSKTLEMDKGSGLFHYVDLSQQFTPEQVEAALALKASSMNAITNDAARRIADSFLNQYGLMQPDAVFYEVVEDTTGTLNRGTVVTAADVEQAEVPASLQVLYTRILTAPLLTAAGVTQEIGFTVVGPGAKQKVALPTTGTVNAAGVLQADPLAVQGGWRSVSPALSAATGEQIMAAIYSEDTVKKLYLALDEAVTMNSIPIDIKDRQILSSTLAYWENTAGSSQGELIPVYELMVRFTISPTNETTDDPVYVPASPIYLRPYAAILGAPPSIGQSSTPTLTLTAADASQTLKALGVGNDFDFVMGYAGDGGTYVYKWYLDSVSPENELTDLNPGDGATKITFAVPPVGDDHSRTLTIVLEVEDLDSPNESKSTAVAQITVNPALFMPLLAR